MNEIFRDDELMQWMHEQGRQWGERLFEEHIPSHVLVAHAAGDPGSTEADRRSVERHLEICDDCREDLRMVREVRRDLARETPRGRRPSRLPRPNAAWAAAAVLLVLLVPAVQGLRSWLRPDRTDTAVQMVSELIVLSSTTERSSTASPSIVTAARGRQWFELRVPILDRADVRYDGYLLDASNRVLWQKVDLRSRDDYGTFLVSLDTGAFEPGRYRWVIEEILPDGTSREFSLPFTLGPGHGGR